MQPMFIDLLPCPFCGECGELHEHKGWTMSKHKTAHIQCDNCEIVMKAGWGKSDTEAATNASHYWNTRSITP